MSLSSKWNCCPTPWSNSFQMYFIHTFLSLKRSLSIKPRNVNKLGASLKYEWEVQMKSLTIGVPDKGSTEYSLKITLDVKTQTP